MHTGLKLRLSHTRLFLLAVLVGMVGVLGLALYSHQESRGGADADNTTTADPLRQAQTLKPGVRVAGQLQPQHMAQARQLGYRTVVDIRPDGEASDQADAQTMQALAQREHLRFAYIPVPRDGFPDEAVQRLQQVLAEGPGPVLLYCRIGRRAARAWALAEAASPQGLSAPDIEAAVTSVDFEVDDLRTQIATRIAARNSLGRPQTPSAAAAPSDKETR